MSSTPFRVLRPALSLRWQVLRRSASTETAAVPSAQPSFISRNRSRLAWTTAALAAGLITGNLVSQTIAPGALPDTGSPQDRMLIADLNQRIDNDSKIKELRRKCSVTQSQATIGGGNWTEIVKDEAASQNGLMASLAGYKALGVERLFWNNKDKTLIAVIWFGASVSGWPGVTHGGIIASQFMEKIGLASMLMRGFSRVTKHSSGTGSHAKVMMPEEQIREPEELSLSYVKPTYAEGFYLIRVGRTLPLAQDPHHIVPDEPLSGDHAFESTLETLDGRILVKAKAKMPMSSFMRLEQKAVDASEKTYSQVKQWIWPSR